MFGSYRLFHNQRQLVLCCSFLKKKEKTSSKLFGGLLFGIHIPSSLRPWLFGGDSEHHRHGVITARVSDLLPVLGNEVVHDGVVVPHHLYGLPHVVELRPVEVVVRPEEVVGVGAKIAVLLDGDALVAVRHQRLQRLRRRALHG